MSSINPDFAKNFDAIFFGTNNEAAKGIPLNEQGRLAKFYSTSLERHDKSNIFYKIWVKIVKSDNYNCGTVLTNIAWHLQNNSATLDTKINPQNYGNFKKELLDMTSALAEKLTDRDAQCKNIMELVEKLDPAKRIPNPGQSKSTPSNLPSVTLSKEDQAEINRTIDDLDSFLNDFGNEPPVTEFTGPVQTEVALSPTNTLSPSLLKQFEEAEAILSKKDLDIVDPILLNSLIRDIQNDPSFETSEAHPRLIAILENYLNRTAPQNLQGTLSEQINALKAHIEKADEIATLIPNYGSKFVKPTPTAAAWKVKIQYLEMLKERLLEKTQANMVRAAEKWIPNLQYFGNGSEKITSAIQELATAVARNPLGSIATTNYASLSEAVTKQLQLAQANFRKIDEEVNISLKSEKGYREHAEKLIGKVLDRMDHFKQASQHHAHLGTVTEEAFNKLNLLISNKQAALEECKAQIENEKTGWFSGGKASPASILRQRTLELEILTLEHQRIVFDSKLAMQKFAIENLSLLEEIGKMASDPHAAEHKLPELELKIKAYTDKCKELDQLLKNNMGLFASHKTALSLLHASLMSEHQKLNELPEIKKSEALQKKIEYQKGMNEYDLTNFVSFQQQLKEEIESKVLGIGSLYKTRIEASKKTSKLFDQREKPAEELGIAQQNQIKLKSLSELIKKQADWIIRWTASQTSPKGTSDYENFLREFAVDAKARGIPEDQWASKIIQRLEKDFIIPDVHKPLLADNLYKALGKMHLIPMQLPELRQSV
ncbi:MAG: hypothetical protein AB7H48_09870 [Parachlamydiales bacterium]